MADVIQIRFLGTTFLSPETSIAVQNGTFVLESNNLVYVLMLSGKLPFDLGVGISNTFVNFGIEQPGRINGSVAIPVSPAAGATPSIVVTNFSGEAILEWPSATGQQSQPLTPGVAITLTGFSG